MIHLKKLDNTYMIILAGGTVLALSFGVRSMFGGVVEPVSNELFQGNIEVFSLAIAIQNLLWGIAQPAFGLIADKYGDRRALWLGFSCYLLGMCITALGSTVWAHYIGAGVLVGMGISGTAFGVVLAVVGRIAPEDKRSYYLGITSAIGSLGQVIIPLITSWLLSIFDWRLSLLAVTALLLAMAICIPYLKATPQASHQREKTKTESLAHTIKCAFSHPSYLMLSLGFLVCGFHLAFITAHLPNYVQNFCLTPASTTELNTLGLQALSLAGLANVFGTLAASWLGARYPKPYILAAIYALRAIFITVFISFPVTPASVMIFALLMGSIWLSTVPLTSALVLGMFGPRAMGILFGFVFLSHQIGSFLGVWLGGVFFDQFGHYDYMWYLSIILALLSSIIHLLVEEDKAPSRGLAYS